MADLSQNNSGFATGATDTWTSQVNNVSLYDAQHVNGLASAILQIEAALGSGSALPGSLPSLVARLAVQVGADGIIIPVGSGMDFFGPTAPPGWLFRDGSAVSRTTYADLFSGHPGSIGTIYGAGDGSTTFNLPNDSYRVTIGAGTGARDGESGSGVITGGAATPTASIGQWGGSTRVLLTGDESGVQSHAHGIPTASGSSGGNVIAGTTGSANAGTGSSSLQSGDALESHENMMTFLVCNKIIKY